MQRYISLCHNYSAGLMKEAARLSQ